MNNNAKQVLDRVKRTIQDLENTATHGRKGNLVYRKLRIKDVCDDLGIFDWWNDELSITQLKQMKRFLEVAIELGFDKYVCFKVGAKGCTHGMWAHTEESTTGYAPEGGMRLFHSFRSGDNYYNLDLGNGFTHKEGGLKLKDVKALLK